MSMKRIIFIIALIGLSFAASAQTTNPFPTTDSLRKFINKWIRNSAVDAFTNLRLNTALLGMSRFIDSADSGLNPSDTAAMLSGYTRLSRFLDSVSALRSAISGAAGTPGGSNTQIQYNGTGAFAGDAGLTYNATQNKVTTDSLQAIMHRGDTLRIGSVTARNPVNWLAYGTSIVRGTGLSDTTKRWFNLLTRYYGKVEKNFGVPGATLIKNTPLNPFGGTNMIDYMQSNLVTKTASDERLFLAFGENDVAVNSANYDTTEYKLDYDSVINFALTKGWTLSEITIVSNGYIDTVTNSVATRQRQQDFVAATRNFAAAKGITSYIEIWPTSRAYTGKWFYLPQSPLVHPGDEGHSLYAQMVADGLGNDAILADGQRATISDTLEVQQLKVRTNDTASEQDYPILAKLDGQLVKGGKGFFIINNPAVPQNAKIEITGDMYARAMVNDYAVVGNGTTFLNLKKKGFHAWLEGTDPTLYAFDGVAPAWRRAKFHAAEFLWRVQDNSAFQLTMSTNGKLESTQNDNSMAYVSIANNNTGANGGADLRLGTNNTGNGGRFFYGGSGLTPNGIEQPSTTLLNGPASGGLNIAASNAAGVMRFYTGGSTTGHERMRIAADGQLSLYKQLTGTGSMKILVKGTDSAIYQIDPSALTVSPALTTNYIGVGTAGVLGGSTALTYDGTTVKQNNATAANSIASSTAVGSTSGGDVRLFAAASPTAADQRLGGVMFGTLDGGSTENLTAGIEAYSTAAHTPSSSEQTHLRFLTTAVATRTEVMRITANLRVGIGVTAPTASLHLRAGNSSAGGAQLKLNSGTVMATPEAGAIEYDATNFYQTNSTGFRGVSEKTRIQVTATGLTMDAGISHYVFSGTTATLTLPVVSGNANVKFVIKNRGSGNLTINSNAGGNDIYDTSAVNTLTVAAGAYLEIVCDGTYFNVIDK